MIHKFFLTSQLARRAAIQAVNDAPEGWVVRVSDATRTLEQNAAQWPYLEGFSAQDKLEVDGVMSKITPEEWKIVLTAAFKQETVKLARGLDGGCVMLGEHTSGFTKKEFSEWLEFLKATAAQRNVTPIYKNGYFR